MEDAGRKLKLVRERLLLRYREVEKQSSLLAERLANDEFTIALSRLADIENKGTVPTIFRLFALCTIYSLRIEEVLEWFGVHVDEVPIEPPDTLTEPLPIESLPAGRFLRERREGLRLSRRAVVEASQRLAEQHKKDEFLVSLARLADIENKGTVPSIYHLYALSVIYELNFNEMLRFYGVPVFLPSSFTVRFSPGLSPNQVEGALRALAEYYRGCGGLGLAIDFESEEIVVREFVNV